MKRLSERHIAKKQQCSRISVHHATEKFKKHEIYDDMKKPLDPVKLQKETIMSSDELSCNPALVLVLKYVPIC